MFYPSSVEEDLKSILNREVSRWKNRVRSRRRGVEYTCTQCKRCGRPKPEYPCRLCGNSFATKASSQRHLRDGSCAGRSEEFSPS